MPGRVQDIGGCRSVLILVDRRALQADVKCISSTNQVRNTVMTKRQRLIDPMPGPATKSAFFPFDDPLQPWRSAATSDCEDGSTSPPRHHQADQLRWLQMEG